MMEVDNKRLITGLVLVFALGVSFAVVNGYYTSQANEQLPLIVYGISFISVLVGAFVVLAFQWKISRMQLEKILRALPQEEREIVKTLMDSNNKLEQNKLVVLTGYTKVKVSRTLKKLEAREVVEKKHMGNTNLVILKL